MTEIEDRLRDVLTRVVPEPPARLVVEPPASRPRRAAALAGAALLVAAAVVVPVLLTRDDPVPAPAPALSPYDAPACPAVPVAETAPRLPDLDRVTSIRLCPGDVPGIEPADALVGELDRFAEGVDELPTLFCDIGFYAHDGSTLRLTLDDGASVSVTTSACELVRAFDGAAVPGIDLQTAFLQALDDQRDAAPSTHEAAPPTCGSTITVAPVEPTRDDLVAAVACPGDRAVTGDGLALLRSAWSVAIRSSMELDCPDPAGRNAAVVATTVRGDAVRLADAGCGYLRMAAADGSTPWMIQAEIDDLT